MNTTTEEILRKMRTKDFAVRVLSMVEKVAGHHFYSLHHLGGASTVREWGELAEDDPSQRTSQTTVRICHDFEYAIAKVLKDQYGYNIVPKSGTHDISGNFDVAVESGETVLAFEVKTTQAKDWTGSTHTHNCGKVPFYVLIQYDLDLDIQLGKNALHGLFKACHFSVTSPLDNGDAIIVWNGEATNSNSRTTGKIKKGDAGKYQPMICLGHTSIARSRKWTKIVKEDLSPYRSTKTRRLLTPKRR